VVDDSLAGGSLGDAVPEVDTPVDDPRGDDDRGDSQEVAVLEVDRLGVAAQGDGHRLPVDDSSEVDLRYLVGFRRGDRRVRDAKEAASVDPEQVASKGSSDDSAKSRRQHRHRTDASSADRDRGSSSNHLAKGDRLMAD